MSRRFSNPWPHEAQGFSAILKWKLGLLAKDPIHSDATDDPAPLVPLLPESIAVPPASGWRAVWLGHASFLLQSAETNLLIDPVFSDHCAPLPMEGMKRLVAVPCALDQLPHIDTVLLTHGHYDHLDLPTLCQLGPDVKYVIAEGHAGWLKRRGFPDVTEVPWHESVCLPSGITVTATPAQHFTARTPWDRNRGHWCGWLIEGADRKLWHAGDSAWCPAFKEIGERHGPIDLGMIPIGAYNPREIMRSMHANPEEAVDIFTETRCRRAIGMHWGTFRLTDEPMSEPPLRLKEACAARGITGFETIPVGGKVEV